MRAILYITSGTREGQRFLLQPGQALKLGKTEWADIALPEDHALADTHFAISFQDNLCLIRDLGSETGTWLNNERILESEMRSGDEIQAGRTTFRIEIEGQADSHVSLADSTCPAAAARHAESPATDSPFSEASRLTESLTTADTPPSATGIVESPTLQQVPPPAGPLPVRASAQPDTAQPETGPPEVCPSGLMVRRGDGGGLGACRLAGLLHREFPLTMVVDVNRIPVDLRPQLPPDVDYLFDWLPANTRAAVSPVIIPAAKDPMLVEQLFEVCWGNDNLIGLFSTAEEAELLTKLRLLGGILTRPSVLQQQLTVVSSPPPDQFFETVQGALVESDSADTWSLFGPQAQILKIDELTRGRPREHASREVN